jgi:hypothetical protein
LIAIVQEFNDKILTEKRQFACDEIDAKIQQVSKLLNEKQAADDFKNKTLYPLQNFKKKIEYEVSIPQISYSVNESQEAFEEALETIEEKFKPDTEPDKPVKKTTTIKPASFKHKAYFDTEEDVMEYLEKVRSELLKAIQDNLRIRIQ